jgi:Lrp/AsnC family leucine-responsive transcriptional regulator
MRRIHDLDAKDRRILGLLEIDARRSNSDIARLTNLSAPTVAERIARLRDIGVIRGFGVQVDSSKVGLPVSAIIQFRPTDINDDQAVEFVRQFGEVRDCYRVTGETLLVLNVRLADNERLRSLLAKLYKHGETRTSVILTTEWEQRPIFGPPLDSE